MCWGGQFGRCAGLERALDVIFGFTTISDKTKPVMRSTHPANLIVEFIVLLSARS
jgi:hypothetical protein